MFVQRLQCRLWSARLLLLILLAAGALCSWPGAASAAPLTAQVADEAPALPQAASGHNCGGIVNPSAVGWATLDDLLPAGTLAVCDASCYKFHQNDFVRGSEDRYTLQVRNEGNVKIHGPLVVTDTLPMGMTFVRAEGEGWRCRLKTVEGQTQVVVCENPTDLQPQELATVFIDVAVDADAADLLINRAEIRIFGDQNPDNDRSESPTRVIPRSDLGDAPDSTFNHWQERTNSAYPGVAGHFPTVWQVDPEFPDAASGPIHFDTRRFWLGDQVTIEIEADRGPDEDGINNILDGGADTADGDKGDDGWLNPDLALADCQETTLAVRISRDVRVSSGTAYLNVWFDGDRNGAWTDIRHCPGSRTQAAEWIVRNFIVDLAAITGTQQDLRVPTGLVPNAKADAPAWIRFTLSEQPAIQPPSGGMPDGRGPRSPKGFRFGETEDYLWQPPQTGEPGRVVVEKVAELPAQGAVALGNVYTYTLLLGHLDGSGAARLVMTDVLPAEVQLVGGPLLTQLQPTAAPLQATFDAGIGPSGAVRWRGYLTPGAQIRIDFQVRVRRCPTENDGAILNLAQVRRLDGAVLQAGSRVSVICQPPPRPALSLAKALMVSSDGAPVAKVDEFILPGQLLYYHLRLTNQDTEPHQVRISDTLPLGLEAVEAVATHGVSRIVEDGRTVLWDTPAPSVGVRPELRIRARLTRAATCEGRMVNTATWRTLYHQGSSNEVTARLICRDAGDAPDSRNRAGQPMTAYPGVKANFPTVYAGSPPRGPLHLQAAPLHLGRRVSFEVDADLAPDADGVTNLLPARDQADLDAFDDGLDLSRLAFAHCRTAQIPVWVTIDATALEQLADSGGRAYLNVWLDANRDGDWGDNFLCGSGTAEVPAPEHLVIDFPLDVAALGPGLHQLLLPTSGPVPWPADRAAEAAWLRLTLSERKAAKIFGTYGDGSSDGTPYLLGETEDYRWLPAAQRQANLAVKHQGALRPEYDPQTGQTRWILDWSMHYTNRGSAPATDVRLVDRFSAGQTLVSTRSVPALKPQASGDKTLEFVLGTLAAGQGGSLLVRTSVPYVTPPGTVFTNTLLATADQDSNPDHNRAAARLTIPLLPPLITDPTPGTSCTGILTVTGVAYPGARVHLYLDDQPAAQLESDTNGHWSTQLTLMAGEYALHAVAEAAGELSAPSPTIVVRVDPSLSWSPLSLRFIDAAGHSLVPKDGEGRTDETGWRLFLRPRLPYTVTVALCCTDPNAAVTLDLSDGTRVILQDPDQDGTFSGSFLAPESGTTGGALRLCVDCELVRRCSDGQLLIDPQGVVFDLDQGALLPGATVACFQAQEGAAASVGTSTLFTLWPATQFGQLNPQTTGPDGYFGFFTPAGTYRLQTIRPGYQPYQSWDLVVIDAPVTFNTPLTPEIDGEADYVVTIGVDGFDPPVLTVAPGSVVEWVNTLNTPHTSTSTRPTVSFPGLDATAAGQGWDSGLLDPGSAYKRRLMEEGIYQYHDHEVPTHTATLIVARPAQQRLYLPWTLK